VSATETGDSTRRQIRGSSLLLSGRLLSIGVKLVTQTLIVRHLATADFGAWAYAVSAVALALGFAHLSFDQSVARFTAMYREQKRYGELLGMLLFAAAVVLATGTLVVATVFLTPEWVGRATGQDREIIALLSILIVGVPIGALDRLLVATFAAFGRARTIFLRRHVVAPFLQLAVVALLLLRDAGVTFLAYGYLLGDALGLLLYAGLLVRLFRDESLLPHLSLRTIRVPVREILGFSLPLATSDWLAAFVQSSGVLLLGYLYSTRDVAVFRAVLPVAVLNETVLQSFTLLFLPTASRLFAKRDFEGVNVLYWRTAVWVAVLSFPVFALTFAAATPLSVLIFGARYEVSGDVLAILSLGVYAQATFGFNGSTLKVAGRVRFLVLINFAALAINAVLLLLLVPRYGAVGAAWGMTVTVVVHNVMKQVGLRGVPGVRPLDRRFARPFAVVGAGACALAAVRWLAPASPLVLLPATGVIALGVLVFTRQSLRIGDVFPELRRLPLLRPLLT
jgi:O-antigen/teichoic acid export membrane protein